MKKLKDVVKSLKKRNKRMKNVDEDKIVIDVKLGGDFITKLINNFNNQILDERKAKILTIKINREHNVKVFLDDVLCCDVNVLFGDILHLS